jgi:hypothetical protein
MSPARCLLALFALALPVSLHAGPQLYKWVDEHGETHYSDRVPPDEAKQGRSVLNDQGITVKTVDAAKTPEELAEEQRLARIREEQRRIAEARAAQDRVLLNTFQNEQAIVNARDAKIAAIGNIIHISSGTLRGLEQKLTAQMKSAADLERSGRSVPPALEQRIRDIRAQMRETKEFIDQKNNEQEAIRQAYEKDIQRYRELMAEREKESR